MTNGDLRNKIDKLWTDFWTGGITNPLTVIEQITYLFFCRMLDEAETRTRLAHIREVIRQTVDQLPTQDDFLHQHGGAIPRSEYLTA